MNRARWKSLIVALVLVGSPASLVRAHGPSLSVFDILDWQGDSPRFVRLLRGGAIFDGGILRYICPARWGGDPLAPLMFGNSDKSLVIGHAGLFWFGSDDDPDAMPLPDNLDPGRLRTLFADGSDIGALTADGGLWRLAPDAAIEVMTLSPPPDSVLKRGAEWLVANEANGKIKIYSANNYGQIIDILETPYRGTPELVAANDEQGTLWLKGLTSDGYRLDRLEGSSLVPVARTTDPIFGPVSTPNGRFVVVGGQLHRLVDDALVKTVETSRLFCLRQTPLGELLACVGTDLVALDPEQGLGAPLLELSGIKPPSLDGLDPTATLLCREDWADAARDAGLPEALISPPEWNPEKPTPPVEEPTETPETAPEDEGCTSTPSFFGTMHILLAIWLSKRNLYRSSRLLRCCQFPPHQT